MIQCSPKGKNLGARQKGISGEKVLSLQQQMMVERATVCVPQMPSSAKQNCVVSTIYVGQRQVLYQMHVRDMYVGSSDFMALSKPVLCRNAKV